MSLKQSTFSRWVYIACNLCRLCFPRNNIMTWQLWRSMLGWKFIPS